MKRLILAPYLLLLTGLVAVPVHGQAQGEPEATNLATKLTEEGATRFNTCDAKAMAASYTDDAKLFLQSKNKDGASVKEYDGREEIERLYADVFKDRESTRSKN